MLLFTKQIKFPELFLILYVSLVYLLIIEFSKSHPLPESQYSE